MARNRAPEMPVRPMVPPVLACGLSLWAACAGASTAAQALTPVACAVAALVCGVSALGVVALLWRGRQVLVCCVLLGALVGGACGCAAGAALHAAELDAAGVEAGRMRFEAVEDADAGLYGAQCVARTQLPDGRAVDVRLRFADSAQTPRYGDVFEADVSLARPAEQTAAYCWQRGIAATAEARHVELLPRHDLLGALLHLRSQAIEVLAVPGGEGAAVLQALVCGARGALDETDVYAAFKVSGLAHLVAVSGAHLVIVCAFAGAALKALRAPRALAVGVQATLLLGYLALSAAPVSAVRAAIMTAAGMTSFFARRRPSSLNSIGVCVAGTVALSPTAALSVSFALSVLSTLGIVLFSRLALVWIGSLAPRLPRFAAEALALTAASSIVAQPLSASLFSQVSLVAPLANVAAAPLFPLVCAGGLVAALAAVALPSVGASLVATAALAAEALCAVVRACAGLPFASVPVVLPLGAAFACLLVAVVALWAWWPRPSVRLAGAACALAGAAFFAAIFVLPRLAGTEIIMLDVGQGDAFLLRSGGATVLVDTGNQDRLLREGLARHGVYRLDAVVVTHGDDDHCGSLASLKGIVAVERVLLARDALACSCAACAGLRSSAAAVAGEGGVEGLAQGDALQVGAFALDVVWPDSFACEGGNADSVCLLVGADVDDDGRTDWTALFTGDAEHEQLETLVDVGLLGQVDVLKVGHHGSKNALTPELARTLSPRLALVSVGARNRYGHPAQKTLAELEEVGARIERTDEAGDVSCKLEAEGIAVSTLR